MRATEPLVRSTRARSAAVLAGVSVLASAGVAGCRMWDDFDRLRREVSVWNVAVEAPGPGFGQVLAGYAVPVRRDSFVRGTRVFVGGEAARSETAASYAVFGIWDEVSPGDSVETVNSLQSNQAPLFRGCHGEDRGMGSTIPNCGTGRRAGAGFPYMHTASADDWWGCVAVTAGEFMLEERLQVRCEAAGGAGGQQSLMLPLENGLGWGASAAGVPIDHPFGVALFGAPDTDGHGALFRLRHLVDQQRGLGMGQAEGMERRGQVIIDGLELANGARFASSLALTVIESASGPTFRIAASFGATRRTVVVADVTESAPGVTAHARVVACLAGGGDDLAFGEALAFGDFDGDGSVDLAVGSQAREPALDRPVVVFDGDTFGRTATCSETSASSSSPAVSFGCLGESRSTLVGCETSRFGQSLAAGDLDGDGIDDLIVGAPGADTGRAGAGVVQTIRGGAPLSGIGQDPAARGTLWLLQSGESSAFGVAVAAIPAPFGRSDIAASQTAPAGTHVFFCSDLAGDSPSSVVAPPNATVVVGCGLRPGASPTSMIDPAQVPGGDAGVRLDASAAVPDAGAVLPDAGFADPDASADPDAGESPDAGP